MTSHASSSLTYCVLLRHTDAEVVEKLTSRLDVDAIPFILEHPDLTTLDFRVLVPEGQMASCIAKLHQETEEVSCEFESNQLSDTSPDPPHNY